MSATLVLRHMLPKVKGQSFKPFSEEEKDFIADVMAGLGDLAQYCPTSPREVKFLADWLQFVGDDTKLCTRMCRAILNHAPIGEYYRRFNIPEEHSCPCGAARQSCEHIFTRCPNVDTVRHTPRLMKELVGFLQRNPLAFGFRPPQQGVG